MHLHDLRGVDDLDAPVAATDPLQLRFQPRRVAGEVEFRDLGKLAQGERRAFDELRRAAIMAHGVEGDFHGGK